MNELTPRPDELPPLAPGRSCEGCTTCCKLLAIAELKKPPQTWCEHCAIGTGCKTYDVRPADCRTFYCGWVLDGALGEAWNPRHSKIVVKFEPSRIVVHVDKDRRDAWRKEPYLSQIRNWARQAMAMRGEVIVWEGLDGIRVLPEGEQRIGRIASV